MPQISDKSKAAIDALTKDEIRYEINLGPNSRFQNEKFAYLKSRLAAIEDAENAGAASTVSILGISIPVSRRSSIVLALVLVVFAGWWNWDSIADRIGIGKPSAASVLEGKIAVLAQNWKLCRDSPGCPPDLKHEYSIEAERLLAQASRLEGDDRRDLVEKATSVLDETRMFVRPYPTDGQFPKRENIEEMERQPDPR